MYVHKSVTIVVLLIIFGGSACIAAEDFPTVEQLWQIVQKQQAELDELKEELASTRGVTRSVEIQSLENSERIEAVGEIIDQPERNGSSSWADRTTIGGYGEMLYNNETSTASSKELDI